MTEPIQCDDEGCEHFGTAHVCTDHHLLRMTAYPPDGPYERWEVTVEATGEVIIAGQMPVDQDAVQRACAAYHARIATDWLRINRLFSNG
jgi:hypothetical protein